MAAESAFASVPGFHVGAVHCGLTNPRKTREDMAVILTDTPCATAAVFTQNEVVAPPVTLSRRHLKTSAGRCRGVVVNAGIANCCTGPQGEADAREMTAQVAAALDAQPEEILVCSTGVIGRMLPMDKIRQGIGDAIARARQDHGDRGDFATAIMTTDLVSKTAQHNGEIAGKPFTIAGAAKGSGMIAPNMATMLGFVLTDAQIDPPRLQKLLGQATARTFNRITVDGDTSTNDTVIAMAGGAGEAEVDEAGEAAFAAALEAVCRDLSKQIARDGEGATHFVTVHVHGAHSEADADRVGKAVAESPLVKTAIAGNDPNWGRVLAAAGRSGARVVEKAFSLQINGLELFSRGTPRDEELAPEDVAKALARHDILLDIDLGLGDGMATWYTCDLTHGYITINADYHT